MLTVLPTQARAAINSKITVSDLELVASDPNGKEDPNKTSIQGGDILKLKFAWDASSVGAKSGDSFEIGLPEQIRSRENLTEPMTVTHQGSNHTVGECVVSEHKITCTFNDTLDAITAQGFSGLRGTGSALMVAAKATDSPKLTVDANGTKTPVSIPGGKITEYVDSPYKPETVSKWANDLTADAEKLTWQLIFGPAQIKEALEKNGQSLAVDGKTRSTITFTDELGPGQTYVSNKDRWRLGTGTVEGKKTNPVQLTDATGADQNTSEGDFDLDVSINGDVATIKVTGPFAPRSNYIVHYESTPNTANGKIQAGVRYRNNATALGSGLQASYALHYAASFTINVEMKPGFGGFDVTKLLTGAETGKVPDGTTFKVGVHYELPGGAKTDAYPEWTAPGTVNQEGTGGDAEMSVTVGAKTVFNGTFPTGTVLTFDEDTTKASVTPDGVVWGAPTFMVGGQSTNTLTVEDQKSTAVTLSNSANSVPVDHGDFTITKALAGDGDFSKSTFLFTYNCTDNTTGLLMVKGGATSETSEEVKAGSTCTITEMTDSAARAGYTLTASDPQTVEIAKDQTAEVTMTNTYTLKAGPSPEPTTSPTSDPATDQAADPATDQATDPATDQAADPATDQATDPATDQATDPATDQATDPATDQAADPATDQAADPATDQAADPATDQATDPATDPSDSATMDGPSSSGSDPAVSDSTPEDPSDPAGGPLASTGVRIGLPLAVAVFAVMGGALLVSRRRA